MKAISAILVAFGATLALIAAIPIIMAPSAAGDVGQQGQPVRPQGPGTCSQGQLVVADRTNPVTALVSGPAGSILVAVNETESVSTGNLYANGVLLGAAPGPYGAVVSFPLVTDPQGNGGGPPWLIEAKDGEVSVCVRIVGPPSTTVTSTTVPESTTSSTPPESTTTTTTPVTSSSTVFPDTTTTSVTPPTSIVTSTTRTPTTSVPPTTHTPTPEPTCTFVGFDIPNVGEWRLTLNDEPVTPTDEGDVLFVAANHGDTLGWVFVEGDVVVSGTLVHDCGEESG